MGSELDGALRIGTAHGNQITGGMKVFWDSVAGVYDLFVNVINGKTHKALRQIVSDLIEPEFVFIAKYRSEKDYWRKSIPISAERRIRRTGEIGFFLYFRNKADTPIKPPMTSIISQSIAFGSAEEAI